MIKKYPRASEEYGGGPYFSYILSKGLKDICCPAENPRCEGWVNRILCHVVTQTFQLYYAEADLLKSS